MKISILGRLRLPNSLLNYIFLLEQFAITDFKMRYSQSILGYFWSMVNPILFFIVYYLVFAVLFKFWNDPHYAYYMITGLLIWNFFAEATQSGMNSLSFKADLLTKANFPRIIIPFSSLLNNIISFCINLLVLVVIFLLLRIKIHFSFLSLLFLAHLFLFTYGVSLILCTLYLKFRDIVHIWALLLQIGFWLSPIVYRVDYIPEKYHSLLDYNPMAYIIGGMQDLILAQETPAAFDFLLSSVLSLVTAFLGYAVFRRFRNKFSEWV